MLIYAKLSGYTEVVDTDELTVLCGPVDNVSLATTMDKRLLISVKNAEKKDTSAIQGEK